MKVLVCGSRTWTNRGVILRELRKLPVGSVVVHGACETGADALADEVAGELGMVIRRYPADMSNGRSAEATRNSEILRREHRHGDPIVLGLAFTSDLNRSRSTRDMVTKARAKGIKVSVVSE